MADLQPVLLYEIDDGCLYNITICGSFIEAQNLMREKYVQYLSEHSNLADDGIGNRTAWAMNNFGESHIWEIWNLIFGGGEYGLITASGAKAIAALLTKAELAALLIEKSKEKENNE